MKFSKSSLQYVKQSWEGIWDYKDTDFFTGEERIGQFSILVNEDNISIKEGTEWSNEKFLDCLGVWESKLTLLNFKELNFLYFLLEIEETNIPVNSSSKEYNGISNLEKVNINEIRGFYIRISQNNSKFGSTKAIRR